jgi:hypothetical protein
MSKEAMKLALDEFKHIKQWCLRSIGIGLVNENVLTALEEALAKQEQGAPVAIVCNKGPKFHHVAILTDSGKQLEDGAKLYTKPQPVTEPHKRKPLTDEQMWNLWNSQGSDEMNQQEAIAFARAIEAAHGIKE